MNREQLLNAIGNVDESMIDEMEQLRRSAKVVTLPAQSEDTVQVARKPRRRFVVCLVACLVLALGGIGYAAASYLFGGDLSVTDVSQAEIAEFFNNGDVSVEWEAITGKEFTLPGVGIRMQFTVPEDLRVPLSNITGDVRNCADEFDEENCFRSEGETPGVSTFSFDKNHFSTVDAAKQYVGYTGFKFPTVSLPLADVSVSVSGVQTQNGDAVDTDIHRIYVGASYLHAPFDRYTGPDYGIYSLRTSAHILTEDYPLEPGETPGLDWSYFYPEGTQVTSQTEDRVVGNREFRVTTLNFACPYENNAELAPAENVRCVFWQENNVLYGLEILYSPDAESTVNDVITEWMNGFAD